MTLARETEKGYSLKSLIAATRVDAFRRADWHCSLGYLASLGDRNKIEGLW